ncbi:DUF6538 domain-containing protein [Marivita sp. S2033]|uniref:DUF6538 domain-containing protein n=1 Tax=Marivita sp. S2033 TaxID=3373187 RepID=UPI0039820C99
MKDGIFYFSRRILKEPKHHYSSPRIAYSLRTKSPKVADAQLAADMVAAQVHAQPIGAQKVRPSTVRRRRSQPTPRSPSISLFRHAIRSHSKISITVNKKDVLVHNF